MPGAALREPIEVHVARLDERFNSLQGVITEMASDQRRLTESYEKLVENNQRVALLESDVLTLKDSCVKLWSKHDESEQERKRLANHALLQVGKFIFAVTIGYVLSKMGIHFG